MLLNEAYNEVLKMLPPKRTKNKGKHKKVAPYEKPEILAITGLTAHAMGILLESAEMFNVALANAMLEVADIFERQQLKLEENIVIDEQTTT